MVTAAPLSRADLASSPSRSEKVLYQTPSAPRRPYRTYGVPSTFLPAFSEIALMTTWATRGSSSLSGEGGGGGAGVGRVSSRSSLISSAGVGARSEERRVGK